MLWLSGTACVATDVPGGWWGTCRPSAAANLRPHEGGSQSALRTQCTYGFAWFTLALFAISLAGHRVLAWFACLDGQRAHEQEPSTRELLVQVGRDSLENRQSQLLQRTWQGSPHSRDGPERAEEKVDRAGLDLPRRTIDEPLRRLPDEGREQRERQTS